MKNKKIEKMILCSLSTVMLIIAIFCTTVYLFSDSYAVDTDSSNAIPTSTFTSNYAGDGNINLISKALTNNSDYSNYVHNFSAVSNYRISDNSNILYSFMKNLEYPTVNEEFEIVDDNPTKITDNGILYILSHGYNTVNTTNTVFTTNQYGGVMDNSIKEYITQIALWLYLYENKSSFTDNYCIETSLGVSSCDFYSSSNSQVMTSTNVRQMISQAATVDGYDYLNYITLLVDNAKNYTGSVTPSMTGVADGKIQYNIASDGKSLITDAITPTPNTGAENYMYYSLKLNDPNSYGAYLVDNNNVKITNFNNLTGSFKIYVPLSGDLSKINLSSITVEITGYFAKAEGYGYRVTNSSESLIDANKKQVFSDILLGRITPDTASIDISLMNFTKISKIDVTDSQELPGASLVIKDSNGGEIDSWVSTNTAHYIFLENGDYELCETIAPEGYSLNTECINFTIDGDNITTVTMKNDKLVDTPDTGATTAKIVYVVGGSIFVIGLVIMSVVLFRKRKEQDN